MDSKSEVPIWQKKSMPEIVASHSQNPLPRRLIWLVVDDVRSMANVGSFFRTADAFGIAGIILCGISPKPPHREIHKTALGAEDTVQWESFDDIESALVWLRSEYKAAIWALEQVQGAVPLQSLTSQLPQSVPVALVVGNEVDGVSETALSLVDGCVEIPQFGEKHSLNVSVAAGVALWELIRDTGTI